MCQHFSLSYMEASGGGIGSQQIAGREEGSMENVRNGFE